MAIKFTPELLDSVTAALGKRIEASGVLLRSPNCLERGRVTRPDSFDLVYFDSNVFIRYMRRMPGWELVDRLIRAAEANQST
ncbi:hypothetical protein CLV71_111244 [Actinophytocola oryzae]|uniref:Uncharacterized protein n=1 Tax=Actinophytocola oryzae TaxID=502181 RepID=A0A4R7VBD2_9PSEU|nr:hypothetical protein CLV71_111244 [Actinophytocola oryzae]